MGTGTNNSTTQTRVKKSPRCSVCGQVPTAQCDWMQGRCPHRPSMFDNIMSSSYKTRFYNLLKYITGKK